MRVLRLGVQGEDVLHWKHFLIGLGAEIEATDVYDQATHDATEKFQESHKLKNDGEVGRFTYGVAMGLGFDPTEDDSTEETGPNWPIQTLPIIGYQDRIQCGLLEHKNHIVMNPDGSERIRDQVRITGKGIARLATELRADITGQRAA